MQNFIAAQVNKTLAVGIVLAALNSATLHAQQHIIANKDNTRPETSRQYNSFNLSSFTAIQENGYNNIQWPANTNDAGSKVSVEYSFDGIDFLPGEQVVANNGVYNYQQRVQDTRPILYRVRVEDIAGSINYSGAFLPKGITISPVQIQNNVVQGNVLNATAQFPVERVSVVSANGVQLFQKDINGVKDFIPIALPSMNKGIYLITFFGNGWKTTSKFLVG